MDKKTQKDLLELVKQNYNSIADDFSTSREIELWPEVVSLAAHVQDGQQVLDVGCGNGRLLKAFGSKNIHYIGVDNSKNLINMAKQKFPEAESGPGIRSHKFIQSDILELNQLPQLNFDYVFSIAVLHHIPGEELQIAALKQLRNKVRADGRIILTVWNLWTQKKFRHLIIRTEVLKIFNKLKVLFRSKKNNDPDLALRASGDFGDILFDWKNSEGHILSRRYYHAFTRCGLKSIIKKSGLKLEKLYKDKHNYYIILKRNVDI